MFPTIFCAVMGSTPGLIFVFLIAVVLSIICASAINKSSIITGVADPDPRPIGGGLILVAIVLIVRVIWITIQFFTGEFWLDNFWEQVNYNYGMHGTLRAGVTLIYIEIFNYGINFVATIFVTYLFFKQRDIFPKAASWLFIGSAIIHLTDTAVAHLLINSKMEPLFVLGFGLVGILASIFLYYINFSGRSRETFTVPHHSLIIEEYPVP